LRQRIIKAVKLNKNRAIFLVIQSRAEIMEAWTMIPTSKLGYVNRQRQGNGKKIIQRGKEHEMHPLPRKPINKGETL